MTKILLATVATITLAMLATPAAADTVTKDSGIKLGLGGYFSAQGYYISQDDSVTDPGFATDNVNLLTYGEINIDGEKTFDNGLTAGARVVFYSQPNGNGGPTTNPDGGENIRESYVYLSGNWGRVEVGQNYSPVYYLQVTGPVANDDIDGKNPRFRFVSMPNPVVGAGGVTGGNYAEEGYTPFYKTGDLLADKIAYYTPRLNGFQAGLSYTPSGDRTTITGSKSALSGTGTAQNGLNNEGDRIEIGANYDGRFRNVAYQVGGGYGTSNLETAGLIRNEDESAYVIGASATIKGWTVGGGYYWDDNGRSFAAADGETRTWLLGAAYQKGPWRGAVTYLNSKVETLRTNPATTGDDELDRWIVGSNYAVAPGVSLDATVQFYNYDSAAPNIGVGGDTANNDATVATLGTTVNF